MVKAMMNNEHDKEEQQQKYRTTKKKEARNESFVFFLDFDEIHSTILFRER